MSSTGFGENLKKETVYDGPIPPQYSANRPVKEAVYGGSGAGTVYGGTNTGVQRGAAVPSSDTNKQANVFFLIAGFSLLNTLLLTSGAAAATAIGLGITRVVLSYTLANGGDTTPVFLLSGLLIAVFVALGIFARRGRSTAFLIGLLLYGADTAVLCVDGIALHIPSIVIHAIFLVGMFKGYRATQE
jgi:hypothetical protein